MNGHYRIMGRRIVEAGTLIYLKREGDGFEISVTMDDELADTIPDDRWIKVQQDGERTDYDWSVAYEPPREWRARLVPKPGSIMADGSIALDPRCYSYPFAIDGSVYIAARRVPAAERFGWRLVSEWNGLAKVERKSGAGIDVCG